MTERKLRRLLRLRGLAIVVLAAALAWFARGWAGAAGEDADTSKAPAPPRAARGEGVAAVRIEAAAEHAAGIVLAPAAAYALQPRREAWGAVVDPRPLLELRARYLAARDDEAAAAAALARADAERRRTAALFADDRNASEKALEAAEADARAARARHAAALATADGIDAQLRQGWGERLSAWARAENSPELEALASRRETLVLVVAPAPAPDAASVRLLGTTATVAARLLSASPQADPALAGAAWFYRAAAPLPIGARIAAELPGAGSPHQGVRVPASAVVWHAGSPWIYVRRDDGGFERRAVAGGETMDDDWFVPGIASGTPVVVTGAQVLLSEELRYQIKNENED